jgi:hypothetical protein
VGGAAAGAAGAGNTTAAQVIVAGLGYEAGHAVGEGLNAVTERATGGSLSHHIATLFGAGSDAANYQQNRGESGGPTYRDFIWGRDRGRTMNLAIDRREQAMELERAYPGMLAAEDEAARNQSTLAPEGSAAYMDRYLDERDKKEAEMKRRVEVLRTESTQLMFQAGDEKSLSTKRRMRGQVEGQMALEAAIGAVPGATEFLEGNPEALNTLVTQARRLAGQNPDLGMAAQTGEAELLTNAIRELTTEIRRMKGPDTGPHPIPLDEGGGARKRRGGG